METQNNKTTLFIADCNQGKELAEIFKKDSKFEALLQDAVVFETKHC